MSLGAGSLAGLVLEHLEKLSHAQKRQLALYEVFVRAVLLAEFALSATTHACGTFS